VVHSPGQLPGHLGGLPIILAKRILPIGLLLVLLSGCEDEEGRLKGLPKNHLVSQAFGIDALIVGTVIVCPSRMVR